jgi:hypothetical protein
VGGATELSLWFRGRAAGFVETAPGEITMTASGRDIWDSADQFRFAYVPLTGDGAIVAQVASIDNTDGWAKGGVMIRETLDAGSKFAMVVATPRNGVCFQARLATDGEATGDANVSAPEQWYLQAPVWVRIERSGNTFRGFYSNDGVTWTAMNWNPQTISMADTVYVGLALTSHNVNQICTAQFS